MVDAITELHAAALPHTVKPLVQFPNEIQRAFCEPLRLFHVLVPICGQDTIKEGSLDIELLSIPVAGSRTVQVSATSETICTLPRPLPRLLPSLKLKLNM